MDKFNAAQKKAIAHNKGPALVVAGAGTGKTAVITARILRLITQENVSPENILALTFTEKAAAQMQDRVDEASPIGYVDSKITTFHGFCSDILRSYGVEIGLSSDFQIISEYQQVVIMQAVLNQINLKYYKSNSSPYSFVSSLLRFFSRLQDVNINAAAFSKFVKSSSLEPDEKLRNKELAMLYTKFESAKLEQNCLDYGDLLTYALALLSKRKEVLQYFLQQYHYILVDEYQDTNYVQNEIVKLLASKRNNLFVVGDDDQSIYQFRGAAITNILNFLKDFPKAKQIVLRENYRSTQQILDASYRLINCNNPYRLEIENNISKQLKAQTTGKLAESIFLGSLPEEAKWVAETISKKLKSGVKPQDIAILLRKNSQADLFCLALEKASIPYELGQNKKLFEQDPVKALINIIKVINNPDDSQALYIVLLSELYNVPIDEVVQLSAAAYKARVGLEKYLRENEVGQNITLALSDLTSIRQSSVDQTGGQILYALLEQKGILKKLIDLSDNDYNAVLKLQYLAQFFALIREYENSSMAPTMYGLFQYFELMHQSEVDIKSEIAPLDQSAVHIMTVHKAKGLEFEVVIMVDMVEQTFPATRRSDPIRMPQGLLDSQDDGEIDWHILEERRLCYVGMTRAKSSLYLTASADHGGKRAKKPSRFVSEALDKTFSPEPIMATKVEFGDFALPLKNSKLMFDPTAKYFDESDWLHLSANQVANYLRSPREFWYFDVLQLPQGPFHSLVYGSAIHAAIEFYYNSAMRGQKVKLSSVIEIFDNSWKSEGFVSFEHEQARLKRGYQILKEFYLRSEKAKDFPKYVEKPFTLRLPELKMAIRGRYDAVFERGGKVEISDFKTGEAKDEKAAQKKLKDSVQMAIYAMAWERLSGEAPESISLNFLDKSIIVSQLPQSETAILTKLEQVRNGILNKEFKSSGESRLNFGKFVE